MKRIGLIYSIIALCGIMFFTSCTTSNASAAGGSAYSRKQARNTIEQTSFIINKAYEIASYYSYWERNNVSTAVYYNDYAQKLYFYHNYRQAIHYSLLAREYALDAIDNCDDYWEYFYFTYYGWSDRYGYNRNFAYANGYRDGYYDGYYAGYCARHRHDYRKDPYRNMKPDWYNDEHYRRVMNNSNASNDRGDSHMGSGIDRNNGNNGTGYRGEPSGNGRNYKNLNEADYYSNSEVVIVRDIADRNSMADEFSKNNPNIQISDNNLKNDPTIIKRTTQSSNDFSSRKANTDMVNNSQIKTPSVVRSETTTAKPTTNTTQPTSNKDYREFNNNTTTTTNTNTSTPTRDINRNTSTSTSSTVNRNVNTNTNQTTPSREIKTNTNNSVGTSTSQPTRTVNTSTTNRNTTTTTKTSSKTPTRTISGSKKTTSSKTSSTSRSTKSTKSSSSSKSIKRG
ncbi:MAG: hypothetical protein HUK18_04260 [Bacteroidales bacterium]|nr:hypothetical protein [Bacteroidales bacterium]